MQYSPALDAVQAKRRAEAHKYRLQVRLSLIRAQAERTAAAELDTEAKRLRGLVDAVKVAEDEVETMAAQRSLAEIEPAIAALQAQAGIPDHGLPVFPRWLEFTLWSAPFLALFATFAVVFALRRRKRDVDAAQLAALDAAAED